VASSYFNIIGNYYRKGYGEIPEVAKLKSGIQADEAIIETPSTMDG